MPLTEAIIPQILQFQFTRLLFYFTILDPNFLDIHIMIIILMSQYFDFHVEPDYLSTNCGTQSLI